MKSNRLNLLTAAAMIAALGMVAAPAMAAKGKKKTAPVADSTVAPVADAPTTPGGEPTAPEAKEALPPINSDDTAFEPSKGKPEHGQPGKLEIITRPSGAEVYYADEYRGKTPIVIDATSGRDDLSLDLDGHNLYKSRVNVWPNATTTLNIELKLPLGDIELTTVPGKAAVTLDGKPIGSTQGGPLTIRKVKDGGHILCGSAGNKGGCQNVTVRREETVKIKLNLK
jgi:PEGA domain